LKNIFKAVDWFEEFFMVLCMLVMVVVNFLNVVSRYLMPQSPFSFTEELTVLLFVWTTMFGIACGYKRHSHMGLNLFTDMLPKTGQKIFILLSTIMSTVTLAVLFVIGTQMVQSQINYKQIMTALKIPEAVGGLAIPVGAVFIVISVLRTGIRDFIDFDKNHGGKPKEGEVE